MKMTRTASFSGLLLGAWLLLLVVPVFAANRQPFVIHPDKFMVSAPLSETLKNAPPIPHQAWREKVEHEPPSPVTKIYNLPDPIIQESSGVLPELGVTIGFNFDGVDGAGAGNVIPPDTNGAVGDKQYFMITNFAFQIYNKATGAAETQPALIHTIFNGFGGQCGTEDGGDPVVLYDKTANRWLLEQLEYFSSYQICFAVSQTDDATGKYNLYSYTFDGLTDYPKLGIWPDAYYLTFNYFGAGYAEPCALDRTTMIDGGSNPAMICFNPNDKDASFLPSDMDGSTAPPKGAPNHYVELGYSNTTINEFDFHVDFKNTKKSTFKGPHVINVPAYTQTCFENCIPQPNNGTLLEALGDRLMFRNAYRNFGDHESLVFSHTVAPGKGSTAVTAERWYEMRATPVGGKYSMYQGGTYQNKTDNYWMGSLAMDKNGDIAFGFSVDNATKLDPSIWLSGRVPTDPKNKLESHLVVQKGANFQNGSTRWGDYSSVSVDPSDDCTMWYTQEYVNTENGGDDWQSHAVSFVFNGCN
jgi:hypothetical protein